MAGQRRESRWRRAVLGAAAGGAAAAGLGAVGVATAEPIRGTLLPAALSRPADDPPAEGPPVAPAAAVLPVIPPAAAVGAAAPIPPPDIPPFVAPAAPPAVGPRPAGPDPFAGRAADLPVVPVIPSPAAPAAPPVVPPAVEALPPRAVTPAPPPEPATPPEPKTPVLPPLPELKGLAPLAGPIKSADVPPPILPAAPIVPLRPGEPSLTVNSGGPAAAPAAPGVPVMLSPHHAVLSAAVAASMAAGHAGAQDVKKADLDALTRRIDAMHADVLALKEFKGDLDAAVFGKKEGGAGADGLFRRINALQDRLDKLNGLDEQMKGIREEITKLNGKLDRSVVAGSSPLGGTGAAGVPQPMPGPAAANRSTVRLSNEYATEVSVILNGQSYRLAPGEVKGVGVPAGSYTYELLQAGGGPVTSKIADGESVTLRIK